MAFNPNEHLSKLQNKDYLEVKWRLVWFREKYPNGIVETEIVHLDLDREVSAEVYVWNDEKRRKEKVLKTEKGFCVCRAIVKDGDGGVGTGTKSEAAVNFGDFIEKAETGAIGRALAVLGFGTQFTGDELDENDRLVDSPVERNTPVEKTTNMNQHQVATPRTAKTTVTPVVRAQSTKVEAQPTQNNATTENVATEQQLVSMRILYEGLGMKMPDRQFTYKQADSAIGKLSEEYHKRQKKNGAEVSTEELSAELVAQKQAVA